MEIRKRCMAEEQAWTNNCAEIDGLHANLCEALADPKRIALLYALRDGRATVNQLAEILMCCRRPPHVI